jgi:homopolymeric O-antigen transport system permease protein
MKDDAIAVPAPLVRTGMQDLLCGLARVDLWGRLGWLEVKRRYRRTAIGPFWSSISLALFVVTLGVVGAGLWNQNLAEYLPYLTSGMIVWVMISTTISEACMLYVSTGNLFRHMQFDFSLLAYALVWRNFIVLLHHLAVYALLVLLLAPRVIGLHLLLILPGMALLMINGVWLSLLLGMSCLRFRDIQQVTLSLVQVAMFVTPIFWPIDQLQGTSRMVFVQLNPLHHFVQIVRAPLLGNVPDLENYLVVLLVTVVGWALTFVIFGRFRRRIAYWS